VLNEEVVRMAVKFGFAIDAEVADVSVFARKNYFYPDSPKGYQISQMDHPIVGIGHMDIEVDGITKRIGVTRAHLEEDAGKSLHEDFHGLTGIDLNRAGTPLLEIVSEPDMRSAKEAIAYMRKIHELVQYLEISDGNMQEGSFRCDANVSIRPKGQEKYGTRTELKNINSFKFVEKAINIEVERQIEIIENGGKITQETRLYDADKNETRSMRSKEEANDYRYFPDPDLLPVIISDELRTQVRADLPELPQIKRQRFIAEYQLDAETAGILSSTKQLAHYFEALVKSSGCDAKTCSNWVTGDLLGVLNKQSLDIAQSPISYERLAGLLQRIADNTISGKIAKQVFEAMLNSEDDADAIIESQGLKQITDSGAIEAIIDKIIADNPAQVEQYLNGKDKVFGFFVGQTMKASQGKANPGEVNKILQGKLKR
jgi:aspartyl-tRNA(Asn)/glutamyl-tRNA(Gln) amidotransferase subunit B